MNNYYIMQQFGRKVATVWQGQALPDKASLRIAWLDDFCFDFIRSVVFLNRMTADSTVLEQSYYLPPSRKRMREDSINLIKYTIIWGKYI